MSYGLAILQKSSKNGTCLSSLIIHRAKRYLSLENEWGFWGFGELNSNTAPQGAHILLGVLFENIRGWEGYPAQKRRKNEENH